MEYNPFRRPLAPPSNYDETGPARKLIDACIDGDADSFYLLLQENEVQAFINNVIRIEAKASDGSALHFSARCNRLGFIQPLIDHGATVNLQNKWKRTPLYIACMRGHAEAAKILLLNGADFEAGDPPLYAASKSGNPDVVELLLQKGADVNKRGAHQLDESPLQVAAQKGHASVVRLLLDHGAEHDTGSGHVIFAAIAASENYGSEEIVQILVDRKCDLNVQRSVNNDHFAPLHFAARKLQTRIVNILLENGAYVDILDRRGRTPLHEVLLLSTTRTKNKIQDQQDIAIALLQNNSNMYIEDDNGVTAIDIIMKNNHVAVMRYISAEKIQGHSVSYHQALVEKWHSCDENGRTHLHKACQTNNESMALALIHAFGMNEAMVNARDNEGHTAIFYAAENGNNAIVDLLLENGASVDRTDTRTYYHSDSFAYCEFEDGRTPLFMACQNGHRDTVALLLLNGADQYLCNKDSVLPFDVASGREEIRQLLRVHDFFVRLEQGDEYKKKYWLCGIHGNLLKYGTKAKPQAPNLEDIVHDMVRYPQYAEKFRNIFLENPDIVNWKDGEGRSVLQVACQACRSMTLFLGRYQMEDTPKYESATCQIFFAMDWGADVELERNEATPVALKFILKRDHYDREVKARRKEDDEQRFSADFITQDLAHYNADTDGEYANSCNDWSLRNKKEIPRYCLALERGDRSLLEVMSAENLSSKDLEVRLVLDRVCEGLDHLHQCGYLHGDVKPRNILRHPGHSRAWKIIDLDASVKIGEKTGTKMSTGFIPPEMIKITNGEEQASIQTSGIVADQSFDVWSFGMTMYNLVTGQSFFHCDGRDNLVHLEELAQLTNSMIHRRLEIVSDVNARVLLSSILKIDPKDRPSMESIRKDAYFNPSRTSQGRQASVVMNRLLSPSKLKSSDTKGNIGVKSTDRFNEHIQANHNLSFFELQDRDKDWNDMLLEAEVEAFSVESLKAMGSKPRLIEGDTIFHNHNLQNLLLEKGPDHFMGCLVDYFELYRIIDDAEHICASIKANLVRNVKSLKGIFVKLFLRGKGLNDVVRGTLFCHSIHQFYFVAHQLQETYNVYMKPPKKGAWPIPKMLVSSKTRSIDGKCMTVEIQFSTVYFHLLTQVSNNHLVYELMRKSTDYLRDKQNDANFLDFLDKLNNDYFDIRGFLKEEERKEGHFEALALSEMDDLSESPIHTGLILSGLIQCRGRRFEFIPPDGYMEKFSPSSFVVDKCLTLLSNHSYWSSESYVLQGKVVEFVVSFKGRGTIIAGIGMEPNLLNPENNSEYHCSVSINRSSFVVQQNGVDIVSQSKIFGEQEEASLRFMDTDGKLTISFTLSNGIQEEKANLDIPIRQAYHLYMGAPPGVHDVKFHSVDISESTLWI